MFKPNVSSKERTKEIAQINNSLKRYKKKIKKRKNLKAAYRKTKQKYFENCGENKVYV